MLTPIGRGPTGRPLLDRRRIYAHGEDSITISAAPEIVAPAANAKGGYEYEHQLPGNPKKASTVRRWLGGLPFGEQFPRTCGRLSVGSAGRCSTACEPTVCERARKRFIKRTGPRPDVSPLHGRPLDRFNRHDAHPIRVLAAPFPENRRWFLSRRHASKTRAQRDGRPHFYGNNPLPHVLLERPRAPMDQIQAKLLSNPIVRSWSAIVLTPDRNSLVRRSKRPSSNSSSSTDVSVSVRYCERDDGKRRHWNSPCFCFETIATHALAGSTGSKIRFEE